MFSLKALILELCYSEDNERRIKLHHIIKNLVIYVLWSIKAVVEHIEEIVLMCCILNLSVIETGQKLNLSSAENVYSSENVESRGSKLKVPVGNETCLQRNISAPLPFLYMQVSLHSFFGSFLVYYTVYCGDH